VSGIERRKSIRIPVDFELQFITNNKEYPGKALNLSVDGICITTPKVLLAGETVEVFFQLPDGSTSMQAKGTVAWSSQIEHTGNWTFGMGVKFEGIQPGEEDGLRRFIHQTMSQC
jgi:uncharacterized protein (TIGR02266 family)